jgi:hypothetical protein
MLEWRAGAVSRGVIDTWYLAYHLHDWLDPETAAHDDALFAGYGVNAILRSLRAAMSLFDEATTETAGALSLPVLNLHDQVVDHLRTVVRPRSRQP